MERWFWVAILSCCISCLQSTVAQAQTDIHATAEADSAEAEEEEDKKRDPRFIVGFDAGVEVLFTMVRLREGIPLPCMRRKSTAFSARSGTIPRWERSATCSTGVSGLR